MEFDIIIDEKTLEFNFEELKKGVADFTSLYDGAQVSMDMLSYSKKEVASLRKLKKALNDEKIKYKTIYMQPCVVFENKVKELMDLMDVPINLIDSQVKAFEEQQKEEKKALILQAYNDTVSDDLKPYISLEIESEWLNKSFTINKVKEALKEIETGVKSDIETIKMLSENEKIIEKALDRYKVVKHLPTVIQLVKDMEDAQNILKTNETEIIETEEMPFIISTYVLQVDSFQEKLLKEFCEKNMIAYTKED